jgi:hypothetical protein
MRAAIVLASAAPPALAATCWWSCECTAVCPAWGAAVCTGIALATGAVIFVTASLARALHGLSRHRPPVFRTEGLN